MYSLVVGRDFVAQHFLIGGDWGPENEWHSHHYRLEVTLEATELDQHGFLVDIVDVESNLERVVAQYKDKTLNELPPFEGLNPSIEHFARITCMQLKDSLKATHLTALSVTIFEDDIGRTTYRHEYK